MFASIGYALTEFAIKNAMIEREEREFYEYAYTLLVSYLITWGTFLAIGALLRCFFPALLYMLSFSALRMYAGGVHAASYERCYWLSTGIFVAVILFGRWATIHMSLGWMTISFFVSAILIFFLSPMEDANKPLDKQEQMCYQKITRVILAVESLLVGYVKNGNCPPFSLCL